MINKFLLAVVFASNSFAYASEGGFADKALAAAFASVAHCRAQGYRVTATVVNADGRTIAVLSDDGASPHTLDSSQRKAYTAASFAPIVNIDKTSAIAERILSNQLSAQLAHLPNVLLVGGGIAIRSEGVVVGGIGVGGAPGGNLDEACASAGVESLKGPSK